MAIGGRGDISGDRRGRRYQWRSAGEEISVAIGGERSDESIEPLISLIRMITLIVGTGELVGWGVEEIFPRIYVNER